MVLRAVDQVGASVQNSLALVSLTSDNVLSSLLIGVVEIEPRIFVSVDLLNRLELDRPIVVVDDRRPLEGLIGMELVLTLDAPEGNGSEVLPEIVPELIGLSLFGEDVLKHQVVHNRLDVLLP